MCWLGLPATAEVLNAVVLLSTSGWCACELASNCWCAPWLSNIGWGALYSGFPPPGDVPEFILRNRNYNDGLANYLLRCSRLLLEFPLKWLWACQQLLKCSSFFWLSNYCWCALSGVYILNFYALYDFEPFSLRWMADWACQQLLRCSMLLKGFPPPGDVCNGVWAFQQLLMCSVMGVYSEHLCTLWFWQTFLYWLIMPWKCNKYHKYGWFLW